MWQWGKRRGRKNTGGVCWEFRDKTHVGKQARLPKPTATLFWDGTFARPCNSSLSLQEWRAVARSCTLNRPLHYLWHSPFIGSLSFGTREWHLRISTPRTSVFNDPGPTEDMQKIKISFFSQLSEISQRTISKDKFIWEKIDSLAHNCKYCYKKCKQYLDKQKHFVWHSNLCCLLFLLLHWLSQLYCRTHGEVSWSPPPYTSITVYGDLKYMLNRDLFLIIKCKFIIFVYFKRSILS